MSVEDNNNIQIVSTLTTEIKKLKKHNNALEANYRYVFDGMTSCMAVYEVLNNGQDFIFKDFNRAAEISSQISREDIIGKNVKDIFPSVINFGLFDVFVRVYKTERPEIHPISNYKDKRITLWVENYVYKLPTGEIVAIYDDITDRKKAEEALQQGIAELEAINAMSRSVSMNISLDEVVDSALSQLMETLVPDLVLIYLSEHNINTPKNSKMSLKALKRSFNIPLFAKQQKETLSVGECLCGIALRDKNAVFSLNLHNDQRSTNSECKMAGIKSYASIPLMNRENIIGVLGIGSCYEKDFSVQSKFLESLSSIIAVSIDNTMLQKQLVINAEQLMNQAIEHADYLETHAEQLEKMVVQRTVELQKFFNAVEYSPASIVITDSYGNIEYANPFFTQLTGYTLEEAKGKNPRIIKSGFHTKEFYQQMWQTISSGKIWKGEICNRKKNGEIYWENVAISPLYQDRNLNKEISENIINFVAVKEDITEKKIAEKVLYDSEQRYKSIFDWSQDGIIIADQNTKKFLFCNNSASNMFGYEKDELVGKGVFDIHPPAELPLVLDRFQRQAKGEITYSVELPCMKKDGTTFYCDISATSVIINEKLCSMGFFRDVTERKRSQDLREDFERIMRHDLKSSLSAVIGFPQMMIDNENLTDSQKKYLQVIMDAGQNMLDIINIYLIIYKVEMGIYEYNPERFKLLSVLRQCLLNNDTVCKNRGITINILPCEINIKELEQTKFNGDKLLAYSIFSNLIINAIEASSDNEDVKIFIEYDSLPTKLNSSVKVIIHNKGAVPINIRDRFFEKYVTSGKSKGTGLGTYSAKLLAKIQGWNIEMKTSEDADTYLIVTIP